MRATEMDISTTLQTLL